MLQLDILKLIRNAAALAAYSLESDFAVQVLVNCRAAKTEHVRVVAMQWHSSGSEVPLGL